MTQHRAMALAGLIGFIALVWGGALLWLGRESDQPATADPTGRFVNAGAMMHLAETLSSDALAGRATGSAGGEAARAFLHKRYEELNLERFGMSYEQLFPVIPTDAASPELPGANLIGWIAGRTPGEGPVIVITAHYDHLGVVKGEIFNGADDNASGAAALVALADHFTRHPPQHDLVFAALDGEEVGLVGARAFLANPGFDPARIALNINLDMLSRSQTGELHVAGSSHTPALGPLIAQVASAAPVKLIAGHDTPDLGVNDWTSRSDHAIFHAAGIPFLYFGVEDHPGYHTPEDDFGAITPAFYVAAADTLVMAIEAADETLPAIAALRRPPAMPEQGPIP